MQQQTITSAIEAFLLECEIKRLKPRSIDFYASHLAKFLAFCKSNDIELLQDASTNLRLFNKTLLSKEYSAQYQHNILRALRAFLKFCVAENLITDFPKITFPRVPKQVKKALSKAEIKKLLSACNAREKLIVSFLLDSGVRANELVNIKINDIDLKSGLVHIRQGKTGERYVAIGVKVRKLITLHLNSRKENEYLLGGITVSAIMQLMHRLRKKSGVAKLTAHALRRTYATNSLRQGVSVHVLAKQMGHSSLQILSRYLDLDANDLLDMQKQFGVVDNL